MVLDNTVDITSVALIKIVIMLSKWAGMSEKVYFQIHYGEGEIVYGSEGVDLSGFRSMTKGIGRACERTFSGVYNWLFTGFKLDPEQHGLTIQAVVNRSMQGYYGELFPINTTHNWRKYVELATEHGWPMLLLIQTFWREGNVVTHEEADVQADEVDEMNIHEDHIVPDVMEEEDPAPSSGPSIQPRGEADEGEVIPQIVEQMEQEDRDFHQAHDEASDDEDDVPVPAEWKSSNFDNLAISEGVSIPWEYRENEVCVGARFGNAEAMKDAIVQWTTISLRRQFRVVKSNKKEYDIKCVMPDCGWRLHAFKGKWVDFWEVSIITEHSCELDKLETRHRNLSAKFVANYMYAQIIDNLNFEPKSIIRAVDEKYRYKISYSKAYRAKQKVFEMRFGTYEASYDNVPRLLGTLCQRNPGSYYDIKHYPSEKEPGKSVLQRTFFALGACIEAFKHCRPVLCIDGTFLTGKYKGQILTAIGVDGNNQVLPLAYAFVESENTDSWYWFLERLKLLVVRDRPDVCVLHDRHAGILKAVEIMQEGDTEHGRFALWPDLKNRWCMRHLGANFYSHFKNKNLVKLFKRLCNCNQQRKFNTLWRKLDELTKKQTEEEANRSAPNDIGDLQRSSEPRMKTFSEWIQNEPREKWALLYDEGGARYGIMTTNLAEVYNWVMRGVRGLPLVGIIEFILHGTTRYFRDRYAAAAKIVADNRLIYGVKMATYMADAIKKAQLHRVMSMGTREHRFEVLCRDKGRRGGNRERHVQECILRNDGCTCSCHKPKLLHRPCTHVIAACAEAGNIRPRIYVSEYFMKEKVMATWQNEIYGFGIAGPFTCEPGPEKRYVPDIEKMRQKRGRRKTSRIRNNMDEAEAGSHVKRCSKCNGTGHTYKKCTVGTNDNEAGPSASRTELAHPRPGRARRTNDEVV